MRTVKKYTSKKPGKKVAKPQNKMIIRGYPTVRTDTELKYIDNDYIVSGPSNYFLLSGTMAGQLINGLEVGTSQSQRIGMEVVFKSIQVKYAFWKNAQSFDDGQNPIGRCLILVDKQPNGIALTQSDVFEHGVPTLGEEFKVAQSFPNMSNRKRFQVLYDKSHQLNESGEGYIHREVSLKCDIQTNYNKGTGVAIANIVNNAIYVILTANLNTTVAAKKIYTTFNSRCRYKD